MSGLKHPIPRTMRLNEAEDADLKKVCELKGLSISDYMRDAVLSAVHYDLEEQNSTSPA